MNYKYVLTSISLLAAFLVCAPSDKNGKEVEQLPKLAEQEPNDHFKQAQTIAEYPCMAEGYIGEKKDQDWFKISIPADSAVILRAELTGVEGLNLKMELMDSENEKLLEVDRQKEGEGEILTNYGLTSGDYFLRVRELWSANTERKFNDTLAYHLKVNLSATTPDVEMESNNKGVLATNLPPNVTMKGYLSPYHDVDWYKLQLPKATNQYLQITLSALENVDTQLEIYDPIEALILKTDMGKKGETESIANLGIAPDYDFYYIVVKPGKWQTNEAEPYRLTATFKQASHTMEVEPNDRIVRATEIAPNDTVLGFLDTPGDVDWYRIKGPEDDRGICRGYFSGVDKVDLIITVFDQNENKILTINDTGTLETEYICNLGLETHQPYYIKIANHKQSANPNETYQFFFTIERYYNDDEFEPNDSFENASMLLPEKPVNGYIHPEGDVDFYRLDLARYSRFSLIIKLNGIMKVNTDMVLYDENLQEVASAAEKASEESERIDKELSSGIYYLKVYDNDGKESNYRDKYKIQTKVIVM